jgi:hypothetical protein
LTGRKAAGPTIQGEIVKNLNVLAMMVGMLFTPMAFADDQGDFMQYSYSVQRLDASIGELAQQDVERAAAMPMVTASSGSSLTGEAEAVMQPDYAVPPSNEGE